MRLPETPYNHVVLEYWLLVTASMRARSICRKTRYGFPARMNMGRGAISTPRICGNFGKAMAEPAESSTDPSNACSNPAEPALGGIVRCKEGCGDKSRRCRQFNVALSRLPGHACDRQNPVDFARLVTTISMTYLTQDEPS